MKLIKLNENHYIIVEDSQIEVGDWYYFEGLHKLNPSIHTLKVFDNLGRACFKITHSTKPLEEFTDNEGIRRVGWTKIKSIELSEVKEAINGYSAVTSCKEWLRTKGLKENSIAFTPFVEGFNAAMELTKDKLFTIDDIINAFEEGTNSGALYENVNEEDVEEFSKTELEEFKKSIIAKTEWTVEFGEHGKLELI